MAKHQLSIRSARARELARELARREKRSVASVVERALEAYAYEREPGDRPDQESFEQFWTRLRETSATDLDLDALIREDRRRHAGIDL